MIIAVVILAAACSQSSDPETWAEALEEGNVETNFLAACEEADDGETGDEAALAAYCGCSFTMLQETFADDFGRFVAVDKALRNDPTVIDNPLAVSDADLRADIVLAASVIDGCEAENLPA